MKLFNDLFDRRVYSMFGAVQEEGTSHSGQVHVLFSCSISASFGGDGVSVWSDVAAVICKPLISKGLLDSSLIKHI